MEDFDEAERHAPLDAYSLQQRAYARKMLSMPSKFDAVGTVPWKVKADPAHPAGSFLVSKTSSYEI